MSEDLRFRVELVFEEIVANIVRHGAPTGAMTCIEVMLEASPDEITLTFDDDGVLFDPCGPAAAARASDPAPAVSLEQAPDGGFGLMLVRRTVSAMHYSRASDARNHLVVKLAITSFSESH